jgi:Tol biopolymer transport system component
MERIVVVLLALTIGAGLTACGSGSAATPGPTPTPTPAPTPTPNPAPSVGSISPNAAPAGALAFTLTVNGSNFTSTSTVEWNGSSRTTTFVSNIKLQAHIMAADLASPGNVNITVVNPSPGGGSSGVAAFTIAADTIAFQSTRAFDGSDAGDANGVWNIWTINPDGSGAVPLTKLASVTVGNFAAVWSPDGSRIAFDSGRALDGSDNPSKAFNMWVINADGSGVSPLTKLTAIDAFSRNGAWSPDGSKIACESARALDGSDAANTNFATNIWVINADGSGAVPLTKISVANADTFQPVWSPDGTKIAFYSSRALDGSNAANTNSRTNIWTVKVDGSGATPLTQLTQAASTKPAWSPDGSKIAFASFGAFDGSDAADVNAVTNIWVVNADGSGAKPLTKITSFNAGSFEPVWSPDGSKVLFSSQRALDGSDAVNTNATENIWVMNADGSSPAPLTKLTAAGAMSSGPVWTPDGGKVLFTSGRALDGSDNANGGDRNIWAVNSDGSGAVPLTKLTAPSADNLGPRQP